jgi:uncharacterized protein with PIN domain
MMYCGKCNNDLTDCKCPDLEERLLSTPFFVFKMCNVCYKHYSRCRCEKPEFVMVQGQAKE